MSVEPDAEPPAVLTEVEAKAGSRTKSNYKVLIVSTVLVVIIFVGLLIYFA